MTPYERTVANEQRGAGYIVTNVRAWLAAILRRPRSRPVVSPLRRHAKLLVAAGIAIVLSMIFLDRAAIEAVAHLPVSVNREFNDFTDFGLSGWFLVPIGGLLVLIAVFDAPWVERWPRLVMAAAPS